MTSKPTIIFVETENQVRTLLDTKQWPAETYVWLAVTPQAAWALRSGGISYYKLEDFYDAWSKCEAAQQVLEVENAWVEWIDDFLKTRVQLFREHKFRPARMHYRSLKILVDQLYWVACSLQLINTTLKPGAVIAWPQEPPPPDFYLWYKGSVLSLIMPAWIRQSGLELLTPPLSGGNRKDRVAPLLKPTVMMSFRQRLMAALPRRYRSHLLAARRQAQQFKTEGLWPTFLSISNRRNLTKIVAIKSGYDIEPLYLALRDRGLHLVDGSSWGAHLARFKAQDINFEMQLGLAWDEASKQNELWQPFMMSGLDLQQIVQSRLRYWWTTVIPQLWGAYQQALEVLRTSAPGCVITTHAGPEEVGFLHAAGQLDIPRIIYQHGGFVGSSEHILWENTDLANADWEFVYGEGVADYLNQRRQLYHDHRAQPVALGSSRLDTLLAKHHPRQVQQVRSKLRIKPEKPMILYIPTMLRGHLSYLCCCDYPDVSYFELQVQVIQLFQRFKDFCFIYKSFVDAVKNPIHQFIRNSGSNILDITSPRLTKLMWAADAIIVDFPSTGLLEVLLTDKPLIIYADHRALRMLSEAKQMLRKRATLAETPEEFLQQIEQFLDKGDFASVQNPDTSFLRAYGTFLNDGCSAERAATAIKAIIEGRPFPITLTVSDRSSR